MKPFRKYDESSTTFAEGKEVQMSELGIATAATDKTVLAVIWHVNEGNIEAAVALFADQFSFKDHGIQLEFNTKERLTEFFQRRGNSIRICACRSTRSL